MDKNTQKLTVPIQDIHLWESNPREISPKDFQSLKKKIERWGLWRPFLVWESKKQILGGNQRYKACQELGYKDIWIEYREPKNEAEALEMAIADNESSGEWIKSMLIEQIKIHEEEINLEDYKINIKDSTLKDLMPIDTEEDNPPDEENINTVSVLGDLYELNNHRVLCGDSTVVDNVVRLMEGKKADMVFTDPPYGIDYGAKNEFLNNQDKGNRIQVDIQNDTMTLEETSKLWADTFSLWTNYLADYSSYFICSPQGGDLYMMMMMMNQNGFPLRHTIIWNKNNHVLGRTDYNYKHEPIIYGWKEKHKFYAKGSQLFSVWNFDKPVSSKLHPTMKPLALIENALLNNSERSQLCVDMFLGSGSTLIACEKTERICYGMELDEHYCDVIVARYIKYMQDNNKEFIIKRNGEIINPDIFINNK